MQMGRCEVNMDKVLTELTIGIEVTNRRRASVRLAVFAFLVKAAAMITGIKAEVSIR